MDFNTYKDERLIAYYLQGNKFAFSVIVSRYEQQLINYVYRFVYQKQTAEDIVQDTFIKVLISINRFNNKFRFRSWLYKIATNLALNKIRTEKKHRNNRNFDDVSANIYNNKTPLNIAMAQEENNRIETAIRSLDTKHRVIFLLRIQQQFSYKEIANIVKCKETTARSRMFYSVEKLREFLEKKQ
ncbi:RNA polymerase sigma factor [Candidatus Uabimicrobium sp. HlEnr_7]|uniref:RNA polymerase sigma factor n=1 Tax=Candidatus Uabimicrobium helgolandensis TaxID=3095367 RepID=UPI00355638D3